MKTLTKQRGSAGLALIVFWLFGMGIYADQLRQGNDLLEGLTSQAVQEHNQAVAQKD